MRPGRKNIWLLAALAYLALLTLPVVFMVRLNEAETKMSQYLASEDRWMIYRTNLEYSAVIESLLSSALRHPSADVASIKLRIDVLHNRLAIFDSGSEATSFLREIPEVMVFAAKLKEVIDTAEGILAREPGPILSAASNTLLLESFDSLRPALRRAISSSMALSARTRDELKDVLHRVRVLMKVSIVAVVAASLLFIGLLGRNNWLLQKSHKELAAATAQRLRSEARLHAFLQNAPIVMSIKDVDGRYQAINDKGEELYGRRASDILGRHDSDLGLGADHAARANMEREALATDQVLSRQNLYDGGPASSWLIDICFPIHDADGGIAAIGNIGLDITELKKSQEELVEARAQAENANMAKSKMLANASHELRTPLNAIMGFGQVIEGEVFGPVGVSRYKEYAGDIVRSGQYLIGIINHILDLSKIEAGKFEIVKGRCSPGEIVTEAALLTEVAANRKGLILEVDPGVAVPDIHADRRALVQVLVNLISNAVKFTEQGGRVSVSCRHDNATGVDFIVSDTGVGIAKSELESVFLPFSRGGTAHVKMTEGSGLGLAISKSLIEQHGGSLVLSSCLGAGTTVVVHLPAERGV